MQAPPFQQLERVLAQAEGVAETMESGEALEYADAEAGMVHGKGGGAASEAGANDED